MVITIDEKNTLQESIKQTLRVTEETKKQISLMIDSDLLKSLDVIAESFKDVTNGKISSRNQLVELAISEYVKESAVVLLDYGINIEELQEKPEDTEAEVSNDDEVKNVAVFPGRSEGFEKVFMGERQWYSIRMAKQRIDKITHVACYRVKPYSEITHYAKVKEIVPHQNNKYRIIFDGEPIALPHPIKRGINDGGVQSPMYTTLNKLLDSRELWQL